MDDAIARVRRLMLGDPDNPHLKGQLARLLARSPLPDHACYECLDTGTIQANEIEHCRYCETGHRQIAEKIRQPYDKVAEVYRKLNEQRRKWNAEIKRQRELRKQNEIQSKTEEKKTA